MAETAVITNIQHFSLQDGPGTRTSVFFKGCPLRCWWCHNPETQDPGPELQFFGKQCIGCGACVQACPRAENGRTARFTASCTVCGACARACWPGAIILTGRTVSADEMFGEIAGDLDIYRNSGGGVTFTGGEPLRQSGFLAGMLKRCREAGIPTAIETAAFAPPEVIRKIVPLTDWIFCDIKTMDEEKHREATGVSNRPILDNIRLMSALGADLHLRVPVIPGFNDTRGDAERIAAFISSLPGRHSLELLPFHGWCVSKYASLGRAYRGENLKTPDREQLGDLASAAEKYGVTTSY